jgi:hypothetical protein
MNLYKIESNVPVPDRTRRGRWSKLAIEMKVGDSVLVSEHKEAMGLRNALWKLGFKAITRHLVNEKHTRVWKIERTP